MISASDIALRAAAVGERIRAAGGDPDRTTVVAVTKTFPTEIARAARDAGLVDLGENYAQDLVAKAEDLPDVRWHFLGQIQRRTVRDLAPHVALWHGVDRLEEGESIATHAPGAAVLVQINVSGEPTKAGCSWDEAEPLVATLRQLDLDVRGLMAVGPLAEPEAARPHFRRLAGLGRSLGLTELSMGMSADLEIAVEEGATIVRVGTSIFGARTTRR